MLHSPTQEQLIKIREECQEDPEKVEHLLKVFNEWLQCQTYLPHTYDTNLIKNIIRFSKGNLERVKLKYEMYVVAKTNLKDIYSNRIYGPDSYKESQAYRYGCVLPKMTHDGYRVAISLTPDTDVTHFDFKDVMKFGMMLVDYVMYNDTYSGIIIIIDYKNVTPTHIAKVGLSGFKMAVSLLVDVYASRIKRIHFINTSPVIESSILLLKSLLNEKIGSRIEIHGNVDMLKNYIPIDMLPKDYGGTEEPYDDLCEKWRKTFVEKESWWNEINDLKTTGPVPKRKDIFCLDNGFGVEGSFRQLSFD